MTSSRRWRAPALLPAASRAAVIGIGLLVACGRGRIDAPPPDSLATGAADTLPALPPSTLDAPIQFDLAPMVAALEKAVPSQFGDIKQRRQVGTNSRMRAAFVAYRSPFDVTFEGMTVLLSSIVQYEGKGWYKPPLAPEVSGSCGVSPRDQPDVRPRARIEIASAIQLTSDWRLQSSTRIQDIGPLSADPRDQCKVTIFKVDVTDRVMRAARGAIEQRLGSIDAQLSSLDVRTPIERWWTLLHRPIRLSDSLWLQLNPTSVRLGQVTVKQRALQAQVGLTGLPRILSGARPPDVASAILNKQLVGKKFRRGVHHVQVQNVRLRGIGGGRVALAVDVEGSTTGRVWFVGTPRFDDTTDELFVPDLDYDVRTADLLVQGMSWMKRGNIRDYLQQHARWPVRELMDRARDRLERGMNRQLGKNATLWATITTGKAVDVRALPWALLLRARAEGQAKLVVSKTPEISNR
jgi:hypothetical protein